VPGQRLPVPAGWRYGEAACPVKVVRLWQG